MRQLKQEKYVKEIFSSLMAVEKVWQEQLAHVDEEFDETMKVMTCDIIEEVQEK